MIVAYGIEERKKIYSNAVNEQSSFSAISIPVTVNRDERLIGAKDNLLGELSQC